MDYIKDIFEFYGNNGVQIDPLPKIHFDKTKVDLYDPFIKTGHYVPQTNTIVLNVDSRQVKDILRSLCHELVHHHQNVYQNKFNGIDVSGKLDENKDLERLESEAYQLGNIMFRKWTEHYK